MAKRKSKNSGTTGKSIQHLKQKIEKYKSQRQKEYKTVHKVLGLVFNDLNEQEKRVVILMTALDFLAKEINIDFKPFLIEAEELVNSHWDKWKQEAIDLEDIQKQIDDIFKDKKF